LCVTTIGFEANPFLFPGPTSLRRIMRIWQPDLAQFATRIRSTGWPACRAKVGSCGPLTNWDPAF